MISKSKNMTFLMERRKYYFARTLLIIHEILQCSLCCFGDYPVCCEHRFSRRIFEFPAFCVDD
jgi:hypothetical protein